MDNSQFQAEMNAKMAQVLRQQPAAYQQRVAELSQQPAFNANTYSYTPPAQNVQQTYYPPSYYQMNPQLPIPVDYPYIVPTR
jgi:hypothetical protein